MGTCGYCGNPAGFLRSSHKECRARRDNGEREIIDLIVRAVAKPKLLASLESSVYDISAASYIQRTEIPGLIAQGWERAVEAALDDGVISEEEESALGDIKSQYALSQDTLDRGGAFTKTIKGAVLRDILDGKLPNRINIDGEIPFNLQKSETLIWIFQDVSYYEEKTRTKYVGGSQGFSVRIAKGFYYRAGAFKGERIQFPATIHADTGLLGITDKHIYFAGPSKKFRIPYQKIVTFEPYSDGICIQRDASSAKPQTFRTKDGWFTYNLIANLAKM